MCTKEFNELVKIEPRLQGLYNHSKSRSNKGNSIDVLWSNYYKPSLERLVGFNADKSDSRITTSKAYEIAYKEIYNCLFNTLYH